MYNPRQMVDSIFQMIQNSFGKGYENFMSFVSSCDAKRALHLTKTDLHIARVTSTEDLEFALEQCYLSDFADLFQPTHRFAETFTDIQRFGLPLPRVDPLDLRYLRHFMDATTSVTREHREKGAQRSSLVLTVHLDLLSLGRFAEGYREESSSSEDAGEGGRSKNSKNSSSTSTKVERDNDSSSDRWKKPLLHRQIYEAIYGIVGHKFIFREGIRNRLLMQATTLFDVDDKLAAKLLDVTQINLDERALNEDQMWRIMENEKAKLCK